MALALAVETEQRNKHFIYAQNEYQMTHLRNILESANFAGRIRDEVTEEITKHIIENLTLPVEESRTHVTARFYRNKDRKQSRIVNSELD